MSTSHPPSRHAKGAANSNKAFEKSRHGKDGKLMTRKQRMRSYAGMARKKEQEELDMIGTILEDPNWVAGKHWQDEQTPSHAKIYEDGSESGEDDGSGSGLDPKDHTDKTGKTNKKDKMNKDGYAQERKAKLISSYYPITSLSTFQALPISSRSKEALSENNFTHLTPIQRQAIPLALTGKDVLAAAPTGSGKTLAFILPIVERLWKIGWSGNDGLGALILSPTRELAFQIFDVLRKVGAKHSLSAGLVIGGKDFHEESDRIAKMNILVCTPGRILQHLDESPYFDAANLQILVLDEADRILDMGFEKTVTAILEHLPKERQTLLFSATQTKSISSLARLSLSRPEYVEVKHGLITADGPSKAKVSSRDDDEDEDAVVQKTVLDKPAEQLKKLALDENLVTPAQLKQAYIVVNAQDKVSLVWSFIRMHVNSKMIIFLSSCKQVRYFYEVYRRLRPGFPLLHITGKMKQAKRVAMYDQFCKHPTGALIATDIASRGLDFPSVEWVLQADCPDGVDSYIHRVGRTARFKNPGKSLVMLLPSEKDSFLKILEAKGIRNIRPTSIDPKKIQNPLSKIQSIVASDVGIKHLAQTAFKSYIRSIYIQKNKAVFDVTKIDFVALCESMGLPSPPRVKFKGKLAGGGGGGLSESRLDMELDVREDEEVDAKKKTDKKASVQNKNEPEPRTAKLLNSIDGDVNEYVTEDVHQVRDLKDRNIFGYRTGQTKLGDERTLVTKAGASSGAPDQGSDDDEEFFTKTNKTELDLGDIDKLEEELGNKKKRLKIDPKTGAAKGVRQNTRIVFRDEEDDEEGGHTRFDEDKDETLDLAVQSKGKYSDKIQQLLSEREQEIKEQYKEKVKATHKKRKRVERGDSKDHDDHEEVGVELVVPSNLKESMDNGSSAENAGLVDSGSEISEREGSHDDNDDDDEEASDSEQEPDAEAAALQILNQRLKNR